jgi:hypothetical protein
LQFLKLYSETPLAKCGGEVNRLILNQSIRSKVLLNNLGDPTSLSSLETAVSYLHSLEYSLQGSGLQACPRYDRPHKECNLCLIRKKRRIFKQVDEQHRAKVFTVVQWDDGTQALNP